jgi:large subunit ribosomal protein L31
MKKDIHPEYREVVFKDVSADFSILTKSTIKTNETIKWEDGNEYPLVNLDISSASHAFYTGKQMLMDREGRVDKFIQKYSKKNKKFASKYKNKS